jgi:hypothetical protein
MYHVEVSPDFICSVTGVVMSDVTAWQARPLEPIYPLVFFDVLTARDGSNRRTSGNPSRSARWRLWLYTYRKSAYTVTSLAVSAIPISGIDRTGAASSGREACDI